MKLVTSNIQQYRARIYRYARGEQTSLKPITLWAPNLIELKKMLEEHKYSKKDYYVKVVISKHIAIIELVEEISTFPQGLDPESTTPL